MTTGIRPATAAILIWLMAGSVAAAPPEVSNVTLTMRTDGSGLADIAYDLADADSDSVFVSVHISADGGQTWEFPARWLSGDVGAGIAAGSDLHIVWNVGAFADAVSGDDFRVRVLASDLGTSFAAHSPRHVAIIDLGTPDWSDPAELEKYSRADLLVLMAHHIWPGGRHADVDVIAGLKAHNPDLVVLGYVSAKSVQLSGIDQPADSFWHKWYVRTEPYFALTTAGVPAQDWPDNRIINITEPDCRTAQITTVAEMQRSARNPVDGVYWDYFSNSLWVPWFMDVPGDPDLDGDGIGHWDDPGEVQAFRDAQIELVTAMRDTLGEDFIQFFNGVRAHQDTAFAALADGALYELFPTVFFPDPDMAHALDPDYDYSLFNIRRHFRTRNGGPWVVMTNPWRNRFVDDQGEIYEINLGNVHRAVALVTDCYAAWNLDSYGYGWPDEDLSLGPPLGPATFDPPFIRRSFTFGEVEIEMKSGAYPDAFDYRIRVLGNVFEELAKPYHTP